MNAEFELVTGLLKQDPFSQAKAYELYSKNLFGYIANRYKNPPDTQALDVIVNNAFERAFRKIEHFSFKGSFQGWLYQIAKYCMYDYIKANQPEQFEIMYVDDINDHDFGADRVVFAHSHINEGEKNMHMHNHMEIIVNTLTERERVIFMLFYEGYKHKEISEMLAIHEGTSKWHLNSARDKIKKKITRVSLLSS